ncbi:DMT family transporter [Chitinophagaceae bacterium LB-8]|uniref:DMT family transporter n=1 Tax=Paraflavisolibacter caeni TaxID=2982496 RepID=A0A9X3BH58_9BACT|nr:DMT family transporter [Paraflavisolibacter caeni]MCU7548992.1 DMT family transporter [Paraflavisolibacter caeni]
MEVTDTTKQTINIKGFILAITGAILFSTKAIIVKKAFSEVKVDALTLLTIRMIFSLPFYLVAAYLVSSKESNIKLTSRQWSILLFLGLFGYYLSSLFDFIGLQYISAGLERLILFLYPTFAVLINALVYRQKIQRNQLIALILTYMGIGLAFMGELQIDAGNEQFFWGSFLIFLCSITFAIYLVGSGRIISEVGASKFTAYAMLSATLGVFTHFVIRGKWDVVQQSSNLWWYGVLLAIAATVLPTFLTSNAIKRIGSSNAAIISSIGPVSTILQAHYFLGEKIFTEQLIGTALVLSGVLLLAWKEKKI